LRGLGAEGAELAPTKVFGELRDAYATAAAVRDRWESLGLPVIAFQSLLFGRPDLMVFGDSTAQMALQEHLRVICGLAESLGARALVFGSPGNRRIPGEMPPLAAHDLARQVFHDLGQIAFDHGTCLCLEPNPTHYGCNFITTAAEGDRLVREVDHPGFRLHLDTAAMTLAGDPIAESITRSADILAHFHASNPDLSPVGSDGVAHQEAAGALQAIGYDGFVSMEMREQIPAIPALERAFRYVATQYGSLRG
jgi:sugar phosphate isomerase/epimerase